jgi:type II secretory pathway pseudopilin PulG
MIFARTAKRNAAFTLVELMIIIIVMSVLAAITIVSYNGVMSRARNAQIIDGARQYYDAIQIYKLRNGVYPKTSGELNGDYIAMTCLGTGYPNGTCGTVTDVAVYEDATFNAAMASIIANTPQTGDSTLPVGGESFIGVVYGIDMTNSTPRGRVIEYALYGHNVSCELPQSYGYNVSTNPATTACEIYIEAYP